MTARSHRRKARAPLWRARSTRRWGCRCSAAGPLASAVVARLLCGSRTGGELHPNEFAPVRLRQDRLPNVVARAARRWWATTVTSSEDRHPRSRSTGYSMEWVRSLDMGPHPLWQLEELLNDVPISPGDRVLDLGCGKGASSVFLAEETGALVTACDLWVSARELRQHLTDAGVGEEVMAINADARRLPFEDETFDVVISIDAFEYFGTDVHALPGLCRVVRPGGRIGMSTPALRADPYEAAPPKSLTDLLGWEVAAWHSPQWWATHWSFSGLVHDVTARMQPHGAEDWLVWNRLSNEDPQDPLMTLLADPTEPLGFALVSATRR